MEEDDDDQWGTEEEMKYAHKVYCEIIKRANQDEDFTEEDLLNVLLNDDELTDRARIIIGMRIQHFTDSGEVYDLPPKRDLDNDESKYGAV